MKRFLFALLLVAAAMAAPSAQASNLNFLGQGPISKFNDKDMDLAKGALGRALAASETGAAFDWANPATGAGGKVTLQRIFERDGRPCRVVSISSRARSLKSQGDYTLCRSEGRWKLAQ